MQLFYAEAAAIVVRSPADLTAIAGQSIRLTCVAYGYPLPSITWTTTSGNLDHDLTDKIFSETVTVNQTTFLVSVLKLCDLTSAYTAEYTCTASNGVSTYAVTANTATFSLSVSQPVTGEYLHIYISVRARILVASFSRLFT